MTARRALGALALVFALAHIPSLATSSLEDIDSVNFALGVREFDVAQHRPHPPGYPVYIALGKMGKGIARLISDGTDSSLEAHTLSALSLLAALIAIGFLYRVFASLTTRTGLAPSPAGPALDVGALAATAIAVTCPLYWYLAVRPMSDLPGLAFALAAQACLLQAFLGQAPGPDNDRRLTPAVTAATGRLIVIGALLAALSIGMRSQTLWFTLPLLVLVLFDRVGRGVAGALLGGGIAFVAGGLAWGLPLVFVSGGFGPYLAALGAQAGEDFGGGEMLYLNASPRAVANALLHTFVDPWDSRLLAAFVLTLAACGVVQLLWRDRRAFLAVGALTVPYGLFHLAFQDTSFVRYALPLVPSMAFLAVRGVSLVSMRAVPLAAAALSIAGLVVAVPVIAVYGSELSPTVRVVEAMRAEARIAPPGILAMHHDFKRPLEAEDLPFEVQAPSRPGLGWIELSEYWKAGGQKPAWFLADPARSDLALIDPMSRRDATDFLWPLMARPAFGGMRPASVRWYRMPVAGWFAEFGWSLTPETAGVARLMSRGPHVGPITAWVRRRTGPARLLVGGRNLAGPTDPAARFSLLIDDAPLAEWDAAPGFFLHVFDIPEGRLTGEGTFARLTIESTAVSGQEPIPTAIEQFDLQDPGTLMWGYGAGWHEAESNRTVGGWRWTSERADVRIVGPASSLRLVLSIEPPARYFGGPVRIRVLAGSRELMAVDVDHQLELVLDVPADALAASSGVLTIESDKTFVPAEHAGPPDLRRLGLRVFGVQVSNR